MTLIKELIAEHGSELTSALNSQLGLNAKQSNDAIESVAPLVLNGLKLQKDGGGSEAISGLLSQLGGSEDLLGKLGNISGLLGGSNPLSALLGSEKEQVATQAIGEKLGVSGAQAGSVVSILVPIVMGFLSKKGREDSDTPDTSSGILAILDRDGDGSSLDDIASMVLGGGSGGGIVSSLLGGILGNKK